MLGTKVGSRAFIGKHPVPTEADLLQVGDDTWIGDSYVSCSVMTPQKTIEIGPVIMESTGNLLDSNQQSY